MATERRLQILCLHGYRQNDVFFREKTGSLRKMLKKYADLHYACAPHRPNVESSEERGDVRGWWFTKAEAQFSSRDVTDLATGFDESIDYLVNYIREKGPFDGMLGFSQGACMLHLFLAKLQLGEIDLPKPSFAILASGFLSLSSAHSAYTSLNLSSIPSLHIFGSADEVVLSPVSERLLERFRPAAEAAAAAESGEKKEEEKAASVPPSCPPYPTVPWPYPAEIRHDGGHFIPPMSRYKTPLVAFLEAQQQLLREKESE